MTAATLSRPTEASRVLALAATETRLILRNRTVLVSSVVVPIGLGIFWAVSFGTSSGAILPALQLAVALGMGVYVTGTQTLVARRHARVLKRLRTSGISDGGLLLATVAPSAVLGAVQLLIFAVLDVVAGIVTITDPLPLLIALVGGYTLVVSAALATAALTPGPERANVTTLPLVFVMLGGAIAMTVVPATGWWEVLLLLPGAALGQLMDFAAGGGTWAATVGGLPAVLLPLAALVAWSLVFVRVAQRRFRWDPRT